MNVSFNKLKSLNGIEHCVNLKFLNVSGNSIGSVQGLGLL
jgi:Leucine-rich repeat (LRR) protein